MLALACFKNCPPRPVFKREVSKLHFYKSRFRDQKNVLLQETISFDSF
jgi:hypothetical protein